MFEFGEERVINSLLYSMPRLRARATISALPFAVKRNIEEEIFKRYVTDALKVMTENTAALSSEGKCMSKSYNDIVKPGRKQAAETVSGDEVAKDVISKITGSAWSAPLGEVKKNE